ncbi:MAG: aldehyde dehydrogenase family protein [Ferruginibacter sp.]
MKAEEAFKILDPEAWATTSAVEKLALLEEVRKNLGQYAEELGLTDIKMKNDFIGSEVYTNGFGIAATAGPIAGMLTASHHLYEKLVTGEMLEPIGTEKLEDGNTAIQTWPLFPKDRMIAGKQKGFLYVKGDPKQINPLTKPAGIIAISGAGNYSSSVEMVKALFFENKAVIHKPHQNNAESDKVWAKIFQPLIDRNALVFIEPEESRAMTSLGGLYQIYFTGSTAVAHAIQKNAKAPLVSECGGNNPLLIIPGDTPWTDKEIKHQAMQVASAGKMNGGAICGRPQTIVTSKKWPQREQFIEALRKAITDETFAVGTYYPGVEETKKAFLEKQPTAEVLKVENGLYPSTDVVFIPDTKENDFAISNEAFCQIFVEIPLDTENNVDDYLTKAVAFCNDKLLGSLGCMILVDNKTFKAHEKRIMKAVDALNYGGIAINTIPANIFMNGYLTWGGCNERKEDFVSGVGNFGNAHNFENVIKSVLIDDFHSEGMVFDNKQKMEHLFTNAAYFSIDQSWYNFTKLAGRMVVDGLKKKDF